MKLVKITWGVNAGRTSGVYNTATAFGPAVSNILPGSLSIGMNWHQYVVMTRVRGRGCIIHLTAGCLINIQKTLPYLRKKQSNLKDRSICVRIKEMKL
jgi:hypothetical protein